tara:strand:+ start:2050 stop:2343 length:294 start_codon:yes stop_codon:yes gene_type:complete
MSAFLETVEQLRNEITQAQIERLSDLLKAAPLEAYLEEIPEDKIQDVRSALPEIISALNLHIEDMKAEKDEIEAKVAQSRKSDKACLAYAKGRDTEK